MLFCTCEARFGAVSEEKTMDNEDVKAAVTDARKRKDDASASFVKGDVVEGDTQREPPAPVKESDGGTQSDPEQ